MSCTIRRFDARNMFEHHFIIDGDSHDGTVVGIILLANENDIAIVDAITDHRITVGNQSEVTGDFWPRINEIRSVARLVDGLAASCVSDDRDRSVTTDGEDAGKRIDWKRVLRFIFDNRGFGNMKVVCDLLNSAHSRYFQVVFPS